jgi:hypothetical protein
VWRPRRIPWRSPTIVRCEARSRSATCRAEKKIDPLWKSNVGDEQFKEALVESLKQYLMETETGGHYTLNAELVKVKQPLAGFNVTVISTVKYTPTDASTGGVAWNKQIEHAYRAKFGDSLYGVTRLKLANEGSIKGNILELIEALKTWDGQPAVASATEAQEQAPAAGEAANPDP